MSLYSFNNVKIKGISSVVPNNKINILDELSYYQNDEKKVKRMQKIIGCNTRAVSLNDASSSDYAIKACEILLDDMNVDKDTIDALIYINQKPDYALPPTAFYIHHKLGLSKNCMVFDNLQACAGFTYAIMMASILISSNQFKKILIAFGYVSGGSKNLHNRNIAPILGDGGTCVLIEKQENVKSYFNQTTFSSGYESLITPFNGEKSFLQDILYDDYSEELSTMYNLMKEQNISLTDLYMNGMEVFKFTLKEVPNNIDELLDYAKYKKENIEAFCFHQANSQIVKEIATALGVDNFSTKGFETYANSSFNTIPTLLNEVYFDTITKNKTKDFLLSGFGAGLNCVSAIVDLNEIYLSGIKKHDINPDMSKKEYFNYWKNKITKG